MGEFEKWGFAASAKPRFRILLSIYKVAFLSQICNVFRKNFPTKIVVAVIDSIRNNVVL